MPKAETGHPPFQVHGTGPEQVAQIAAHEEAWTLDLVLRRDPHAVPFSDSELLQHIGRLRAERTQIDVKQEHNRQKRKGNDDEETEEVSKSE